MNTMLRIKKSVPEIYIAKWRYPLEIDFDATYGIRNEQRNKR